MSAGSRKKVIHLLVLALIVSIVVLSIVVVSSYWVMESRNKLLRPWKTVILNIEGYDINQDFFSHDIAFWENGNLLLPGNRSKYFNKPLGFGKWEYERKNIFHGEVIIHDSIQNIFSGVYEIEIVEKSKPQLMRLYSDSIEFYLREQYFTIENPTIESEPYYIPEKDEDEQKN